MEIPKKGKSRKDIFKDIKGLQSGDLPWRSGRCFGYAFNAGSDVEEIAKRAYSMYLMENALDPRVYPALLRMERDVVSMSIKHLNGGEDVVGNFTSGGTESIMLAVKAARDRAARMRPEIKSPEIVIPVTAHAAFHKAAHYLNLTPVVVPVDMESFRADPAAIRHAVTGNTIMIAASAPCYGFGVVDPLREIGEIALEHDLWLHVDGCIGVFVLAYLERLGITVPEFDFRVPGISSISMDLHKYGFCPMGASVVLYRDCSLRKYQMFACSEWAGYTLINTTVQSSRSGGPIAAAWAVMQYLGEDGYLKIIQSLYEGTRSLASGLEKTRGIHLMAWPDATLVSFRAEGVNNFHLVDCLRKRGWFVHPQLKTGEIPESLHLTVLPGNIPHIDRFIRDVREGLKEAGTMDPGPVEGAFMELIKGRDTIEDRELAEIIRAAGVVTDAVPTESEPINSALNSMPGDLASRLIIEYYNQLFIQ